MSACMHVCVQAVQVGFARAVMFPPVFKVRCDLTEVSRNLVWFGHAWYVVALCGVACGYMYDIAMLTPYIYLVVISCPCDGVK